MDVDKLARRIAAGLAVLGTTAVILWEVFGSHFNWDPDLLLGNHGGIFYVATAAPIAAIALCGLATGKPTGRLGRSAFGLNVAILLWLGGRFLHEMGML